MRTPRFHHVVGADVWLRCDHDRTQVHDASASVRLASVEQADGSGEAAAPAHLDPDVFKAALRARGGAALARCRPDLCADAVVVLADPGGGLFALREPGWEALTRRPPEIAGETRFAGEGAGTTPFDEPGALAADRFGRLWLLERGSGRARLLDDGTLRVLATVEPPPGAGLIDLGVASFGLVAADRTTSRLWRQAFGGEWHPVRLPGHEQEPGRLLGFTPVAVAGHAAGPAVAILRPDAAEDAQRSRLVVIAGDGVRVFDIPALEDPLPIVMPDAEHVLIGEAGPPGAALTVLIRFSLGEAGLAEVDTWAVRGFDGRALFCGPDGRVHGTTAKGARALFARRVDLVPHGIVETFALDSELYGCDWHRVFVDVCLPLGTTVEVAAKTSDDLPPDTLRRPPRAALGRSEAAVTLPGDDPREAAWKALPLGSRMPGDREGWEPLGPLDRRPPEIDVPLPPLRRALPSEDAYAASRAPLPEPVAFETLEGLLKNSGGRYLWLRLTLSGTARRSPALRAVRATYPRPSLLDHLPSYWRAEPAAARAMEHALALFEGAHTETDRRITEFCRLLDPRTTPPEALEWLAGFVALAFDTRIGEPVRRQLLAETTALYRQRGTVPGLRRLVAILGTCEVQIVEGFRVRRRMPAFLGEAGAAPRHRDMILGPGLQLGAQDAGEGEVEREAWEAELLARHRALLARREAIREEGGSPCPVADPPTPLDPDPLVGFYRRHAHRFSVLLFRPHEDDLAEVVDAAIEANKPAHTLHTVCWLDAGFRLGTNTYVGIGTRFGGTESFRPAVLESPIGADRTVGAPPRDTQPGFFVGTSRLGATTPHRKAGKGHGISPR